MSTSQMEEKAMDAARMAFKLAEEHPQMVKCPRCKGDGYHHGFGEDGFDPDWCNDCGGGQYVLADGEGDRALKEAIRAYLNACGQDGEAVAQWQVLGPDGWTNEETDWIEHHRLQGYEVRALYTSPQEQAPEPVAVKVKPLEWREMAGAYGSLACETIVGHYLIHKFADGYAWFLDGSGPGNAFPAEADAKGAAQADFEARILSALSPQEAPAREVAWRWKDGDDRWQCTADEDRASHAFRVEGHEVMPLFDGPASPQEAPAPRVTEAMTSCIGQICASEGCGKPATVHFIRHGVGSHYCPDCFARVAALSPPVGTGERT